MLIAHRSRSLGPALFAVLLLFASHSRAAGAGENRPADVAPVRPRVGVALSGGGARGIAHIGALRALEHIGVPVDYIAGTSIGAVIGGLYAAGLSLDEIENELRQLDWFTLFGVKPSRETLPFRRKADADRYFFDVELGLKEGRVITPRGTVSTHELQFLLERLTAAVADVDDFDRLHIAFRSVTADLVSSELIVLGRGSLAQAILASMAIPGLFAPVQIDGKVLVDGGVIDNLPVSVVRSMGADVVIAVDTTTRTLPRDELHSLTPVTIQALGLASQQRLNQRREEADILITPALENGGTMAYADVDRFVASGEAAAAEHASALAELAIAAAPESIAAAADPPTSSAADPIVLSLAINGMDRVDERLIAAVFDTAPGACLDYDVLHADLRRVMQLGEFETVSFDLIRSDAGVDVVIQVHEKPWGPHYYRFGLNVFAEASGRSGMNLLLNYTWASVNAVGAEWRTELRFGRDRSVYTELYQPWDFKRRFFVVPFMTRSARLLDRYVLGRKIAEYQLDALLAGIDMGIQFGSYGELRMGAEIGGGRLNLRSGIPLLEERDLDVANLHARLVIDRLDSGVLPRDGVRFELGAALHDTSLGSEDDYSSASGHYARYWTSGRHTIFAGLAAAGAVHGSLPDYDEAVAGGLLSFSGFAEQELRGQLLAIFRPGYLYRIADLPATVGFGIYLGGWAEIGNVWTRRSAASWDDLRYASTAAVAVDTRLGPVFLAYGQEIGDDNSASIYLVFGPRF